MEPTLHCARPASGCLASAADRIVVQSPLRNLRRGDVVAFYTPPSARIACGAGGVFIKRVIGLPGESWAEREGFVYINGKKLNEPYIAADRRDFQSYPSRKIASDKFFMMGDNRQASCDSRRWGTVGKANVIGKVVRIDRPG
jgi:signal peptidase I